MLAPKIRRGFEAASLLVLVAAFCMTGTVSAQMDAGTAASIQANQQSMQASQQAAEQANELLRQAARSNDAMQQSMQASIDASGQPRGKQVPKGRTDKPVFSPKPGTYSRVTTVTISDAVPNTPIHYTTDGSEPNSLSPVYKGPIQVTSSMRLKAIAESRYYASPIVRAKYKIESAQSTSKASQPSTKKP